MSKRQHRVGRQLRAGKFATRRNVTILEETDKVLLAVGDGSRAEGIRRLARLYEVLLAEFEEENEAIGQLLKGGC